MAFDLDSAIQHCEEVAKKCEWHRFSPSDEVVEANLKCAEEHRQLAEWLRELKSFREVKEDIQKTIDETRENGKYHAQSIRDNGELMIFGMEIALDIIEKYSNSKR